MSFKRFWIILPVISVIIMAWIVLSPNEIEIVNPKEVKYNEIIPPPRINNEKLPLFSKEHEIRKSNLYNSLWQMYYYLNTQKQKFEAISGFKIFGNHLFNQTISMLADFENLISLDISDEWHRSELQNITNLIQERLYKLQHPISCSNARILICEFWECGMGCLIHRAGYCLRIGTVSNRTMVFKDDAIGNYSKNEWSAIFKPISKCTYAEVVKNEKSIPSWTSIEQIDRVTTLIKDERKMKRTDHLPLSFPKQLADRLLTHHSNPALFFGAQFYWYLTRPTNEMKTKLDNMLEKASLNSGPIVGLHIRRTDKKIEAKYYPVEDYFKWAEGWFQIQDRRNIGVSIKRRVYIATDEPEIIGEAKQKYPNYEINANVEIAKIAQVKKIRYSNDSFRGIFADSKILSKCDFVVCTLSSNICRLVYELMQTEKGDAAHALHSLDVGYGNHNQRDHQFTAIMDNELNAGKGELELKVGDILIANKKEGHLYTGFLKAYNTRTKQNGLFPSFKVKENWKIVDFPIFEP